MANPFLSRRQPRRALARRPDRGRSMAASAMRIDLGDRTEVKKVSDLRQSWQAEAWAYRRNVGECRYADNYLANSCMRLRIHPAVYEPGANVPSEIVMDNIPDGIPADLAQAALDVMTRLAAGGPTAIAQIMKKLTSGFFMVGECYLVCITNPLTGLEDWSIKSTSEIRIERDGKVYLIEDPHSTNKTDMVFLDPNTCSVERLWWPDPQWSMMADSPIRAQLDTLEELLLLGRDVRATARSRVANNGILFIPEDFTVIGPSPETDDSESDPVTAMIMESMTVAMANEGSAAAVAPIILRGPSLAGGLIKHITFERTQNKFNIQQRQELIRRFATGIDLPASIITGMEDANHWSAWAISDDMFRHHVEPLAVVEVDALTAGFMWPQLDAMNRWPPELVRRVLVWYDPTELVTHPDRALDAKDDFDRGAIGRDALRKYTGMQDEDAPNQIDAALYILKNSRGVDPAIVSTMLKQVAKDIDFPDVQPKGGNVEVDPATGQPILPPATPAPAVGPAPAAPENNSPDTNPGPPAGASSADDSLWRRVAAAQRSIALVAAVEPAGKQTDAAASRKLVEIDRELRAKIQTAANAAVRGVLEKAGAKIVSKSRTAGGAAIRDAIVDVPRALIAGTLGSRLVASLGLTEHDLMDAAFADLKKQWDTWVATGQEQALRAAARIAGVDVNTAYGQLAGTMSDDLDEGWAFLVKALQASTAKWLTTAPVDGVEIQTTNFLSAGLVRAALSIAGGFGNGSSAGIRADGTVVDPTEKLGGIGNGDTISGFLTQNGIEPTPTQTYTWIHGGTDHPFEPHEALDGVNFSNFDDPVLANDGDFPDVDFFMPGDHDGCTCDFEVNYGGFGITDPGEASSGDQDAAVPVAASAAADLTLYRGISMTVAELAVMTPGLVLTDPQYAVATTNASTAAKFAPGVTVMEFTCPRGGHLAALRNDDGGHLLSPGLRYEIVKQVGGRLFARVLP